MSHLSNRIVKLSLTGELCPKKNPLPLRGIEALFIETHPCVFVCVRWETQRQKKCSLAFSFFGAAVSLVKITVRVMESSVLTKREKWAVSPVVIITFQSEVFTFPASLQDFLDSVRLHKRDLKFFPEVSPNSSSSIILIAVMERAPYRGREPW